MGSWSCGRTPSEFDLKDTGLAYFPHDCLWIKVSSWRPPIWNHIGIIASFILVITFIHLPTSRMSTPDLAISHYILWVRWASYGFWNRKRKYKLFSLVYIYHSFLFGESASHCLQYEERFQIGRGVSSEEVDQCIYKPKLISEIQWSDCVK